MLQRNSNSCAFGMTTLGIGATLSSRTWPQIVNSDRTSRSVHRVLIGQFLGIWWKPRCSERSHIFLRTKRLYDLYVWWSLIDFHSVGCARAFPVKPYAQVFAPRSPRLCVSSWFGCMTPHKEDEQPVMNVWAVDRRPLRLKYVDLQAFWPGTYFKKKRKMWINHNRVYNIRYTQWTWQFFVNFLGWWFVLL